jgi:hypothetical protein
METASAWLWWTNGRGAAPNIITTAKRFVILRAGLRPPGVPASLAGVGP